MLWKGRRESDNVVDERRVGARTVGGGTLLIGAVVVYLMGGNPLTFLLQNLGSVQSTAPQSESRDADRKTFAAVVLADTEDVWTAVFRSSPAAGGRSYRAPKLVLFRGMVESGCGGAGRSTGPFYCPLDERVYLDLSFLDDLAHGLGATGEFAGAYVIAHEVGHHVQKILGIEAAFRAKQARLSSSERNRASVTLELQADCFAGAWAMREQSMKNVLEAGDVDQALGAAAAVGDDRLQRRSGGSVVPDSFTHGSSADRTAAFRRGFAGGDLGSCL